MRAERKYIFRMVFSTNIFLFAFLPCCLAGYYLLKGNRRKQNGFLLICSLLFYAWGGIAHLFLMLGSITANWAFARWVEGTANLKQKKCVLCMSVALNVLVLFVFKYLGFFCQNINLIAGTDLPIIHIALPIGISFYTFQAMSYVIDVYWGRKSALKSILDVGLYISLFPQLIAGPIVRYEDFAEQIYCREETLVGFSEGIFRFVYGLGKKVLLADTLSIVAESAFSSGSPSMVMAWMGAVAFTLQIYFDFSGYSDMAIGLGKLFGFQFMENFNYPYISTSVSEFWRRWHISMGSWFRDYVYFPLGGSRVKPVRRTMNLLIVWILTGLWHGANWTFVAWGLLQFIAISLEKTLKPQKIPNQTASIFGFLYTMLFVMGGWIFFNSASLKDGFRYLGALFWNKTMIDSFTVTLLKENVLFLLLGIVFSTPLYRRVKEKYSSKTGWNLVESAVMLLIFALSLVYIAKGSYSPFIYFNF